MPPRSRRPARRPRRKAPAKKARRPARRSARRPARRGNLFTKVQGRTGGQTASSFSHSLRSNKPRKVSALGAPSRYVVNAADIIQGTPGQQKTKSVGQWFSMADIVNLSVMVPSILTTQGVTPTHFFLQGVTAEVTLNNATATPQMVDVYDIVARRDIPLQSVTGAPYSVNTPYDAWITGMFDQNVGSASPGLPIPSDIFGAKPTDSQIFNDYYRIVRRTELVLPQNATHVHKVNINVNRSLNLTEVSVMKQYLGGLKDVTHYTMCVVRGGIGLDFTAEVTTSVSPYIRYISLENYRFSFLQASGSEWKYSNTLTNAEDVRVLQLNNPTLGGQVQLG